MALYEWSARTSSAVFDCAGSGSLPDLLTLTDSVVTIAGLDTPDRLSRSAGPGADPPALHALPSAAALAADGGLTIPVAATYPLSRAAAAHTELETHHTRGKIVLIP